MNISNIRQELSEYSKKVYIGKNVDLPEKQTALVVTHLLFRGGAPLVLLDMVDCLANRYNIILISQQDGELSKEFTDKGYTIYVGDLGAFICCSEKVWNSFDMVFLNTIASNPLCELFQNKYVPVIWWLHEPQMIFEFYKDKIDSLSMLSNNYEILSVSDLTAECVQNYYGIESQVLHMGIRDALKPVAENSHIIRFFIPAAFIEIKGTDIIEQAIRLLPQEYIDKSEFYFAGTVQEDRQYYELIERLSSDYFGKVFLLGELNREKVYEYYEKCDCVIAPSRVDATPTTIVEAMMFEKLAICSDACGITHYMNNGEDGLIFHSENIYELSDIIIWAINNYYTDECSRIRKNGRNIFLNNFDQKVIERKLINIIDKKTEYIKECKDSSETNKNKVSIVIPCHNGEDYIERCLDSIISQSYGIENIEIIVVDDGSTDRSVEIVKRYEHNYPDNLLVICCEVSGGAGCARNIGTSYTTGRYIMYVDADDMLLAEALKNMVTIANVEDCDWVECGYQHFANGSEIKNASIENAYKVRILTAKARGEELLKAKDKSAPWGKLFKRSFIFEHNIVFPEGLLYEDCFFSQLCYMYAHSIVYIDAKYYAYFYNLNGETWSADKIKNRGDILAIQDCFVQECIERKLINEQLAPYASELEMVIAKKVLFDSYSLFSMAKVIGKYGILFDYVKDLIKKYPSILRNKYLVTTEDGQQIVKLLNRITGCDKLASGSKCVGCGACKQVCRHNAVERYVDDKGFFSYRVDTNKCINCGLCMEVCPVSDISKDYNICNNKGVLAIQAEDGFRMISSSGGVFGIIMTKILNEGGLVAGAVIEHKTGKVKHILSGNIDDCIQMLKSKYVQSDTSDVYREVRKNLIEGKKILFSGTPCQIAGLKSYLRVSYENLYTSAIVCHGVPSPGVFESYLNEINERVGEKASEIDFRNKEVYGWNTGLSIKYDDCIYTNENDLYIAGFLSNWYLRDSCYNCSFKGNVESDIVIGDFWGIDAWSSFEDGKGTSLVIINTSRGEKIINECRGFFKKIGNASLDYAVWGNPMIINSADRPLASFEFWDKYKDGKNSLSVLEEMIEEKHYDVGLVLWWSQNYGNALTNFALNEVVKSLGYSVVAFDNIGLPPLGKFMNFAKSYFSLSSMHMPHNNRFYSGKICDNYIVGSDQTWNHCMTQNEGCGNLFYLDWVQSGKKKIAYAVSAGNTNSITVIKENVDMINAFDGIAVREADMMDVLRTNVKRAITPVLDPVFLLDKKGYDVLLSKTETQEEYIFTYILSPNSVIKEFVMYVEKELHKKCINVISPYVPKYEENKRNLGLNNIIDGLSVEQWLTLLKNAKYVITDSFHGTCFSIIFEKNFTSFVGVNGESRFEILNKILGSKKNLVYENDVRECKEILQDGLEDMNYSTIKNVLNTYKEDSISWLRNMLMRG